MNTRSTQPPPGGQLTDEELRTLRTLLARFAAHSLDQWECWRVGTPSGDVYIDVSRVLPPETSPETYFSLWPIEDHRHDWWTRGPG